MDEDQYTTVPMEPEEGQKLTDDLQEVLKRYDAELGVTSTIQLLKRVKIEKTEQQSVVSPIQINGDEGKEADTTTA